MQPLAKVTPATADVLDVLVGTTSPTWGLRIVKDTGRPAGSVYPILERLERLGWVSSRWDDDAARSGPRRRLYELTNDGASAAAAVIAQARARTPRPRAIGAEA